MRREELTCIVCPVGCQLEAMLDDAGAVVSVEGNTCKRGERYARSELTAPVRMVTSTVALEGGIYARLPVITSSEVPKGKVMDVMREIHGARAVAPISIGDVVIRDVCGLGVDIVASRSMGRA